MAESSSSLAVGVLEAPNAKGDVTSLACSLPIAGENPPNKDFGRSLAGSCFCSPNKPNDCLGVSCAFGAPKKLGVVGAGAK